MDHHTSHHCSNYLAVFLVWTSLLVMPFVSLAGRDKPNIGFVSDTQEIPEEKFNEEEYDSRMRDKKKDIDDLYIVIVKLSFPDKATITLVKGFSQLYLPDSNALDAKEESSENKIKEQQNTEHDSHHNNEQRNNKIHDSIGKEKRHSLTVQPEVNRDQSAGLLNVNYDHNHIVDLPIESAVTDGENINSDPFSMSQLLSIIKKLLTTKKAIYILFFSIALMVGLWIGSNKWISISSKKDEKRASKH